MAESKALNVVQTVFQPLDDREFDMFRSVVYSECGIWLSDAKKALVQSRLMKRLRQLKMYDYRDYLEYLNNNYHEEKSNFINCITTNKTEFFREPYHLEYMTKHILPPLVEQGRERVRIWSAGCSTGEEAYTIAITMLEFYRGRRMPDIRVLATDIDTAVLRIAIDGVYAEDAVKRISPALTSRYFLRGRGSARTYYMVKDEVKNLIRFRHLNLLNERYPMKSCFDVIFCRNVFIYFDRESKRKVLEQFYRHLDDTGYLITGLAESITGERDLFLLKEKSIHQKVPRPEGELSVKSTTGRAV